MSFLSHWKVLVIGSVLLLCVSLAHAQNLPSSPPEILHDISVKLYENKATSQDYQVLQNMYINTQSDANKRIVLALATQYQRETLKNPALALNTALQHVISQETLEAWKKDARCWKVKKRG